MEVLALLVFGLGLIVALVGGIWLLIKMFQESILWGLGGLFCSGIIPLVFVILHWDEGGNPFLVNLGGLALMFVAGLMSPDLAIWTA